MSFSTSLNPTAHLLGPIIGLNLWTFVMEGWMYKTRIQWFQTAKPDFKPTWTKSQFEMAQPADIRYKADNYNHLFEQPTQFYAVAVVLALMGAKSKTDLALAWGYVAGRVVHSFVQSCGNHIPTRFRLHLLNSVVLLGMTVRAGSIVYNSL
jgi:hypothetical protein